MLNITITPKKLWGSVTPPGSKSYAHRQFICAALGTFPTEISCKSCGEDLKLTVSALQALGAKIEKSGVCYRITPISQPKNAQIFCGESGSTLRFLLPVVAALGCGAVFTLGERLSERPIEPLLRVLRKGGAEITRPSTREIKVGGKLKEHDFTIDAELSSQFATGLLLALPILGGGTVTLAGKPVSLPYLEITRDVMKKFFVPVERKNHTLIAAKKGYLSPAELSTEADCSAAAFWLAASRLSGEEIAIFEQNENSLQADACVNSYLDEIEKGDAVIDASQCPDLVPVLTAFAACTPGKTEIIGASRLREKESDRLYVLSDAFCGIGADVRETDDGLIICGKETLEGGTVNPRGDHRIAMAAAIASVRCKGNLLITDAECVKKSYPDFWDDFARLGGVIRKEENYAQRLW